MTNKVGLWIDYQQTVIVFVLYREKAIKRITSDLEKDLYYLDPACATVGRRLHPNSLGDYPLRQYLDKVMTCLRDADSILILGPGATKFALQKWLEVQGRSNRIVAIKNAAKMTDHQIVAEVRRYFRDSQPDLSEAAPAGVSKLAQVV